MRVLTKSDLQGSYDCSHSGETDPRIENRSDFSRLTRTEGFEVLHFLNRFALKHGLNRDAALKAERGLLLAPADRLSRLDLTHWIEINWERLQ